MNTTKMLSSLLVVVTAMLLASISYAESYYRWTDENGVIHYGSRPPHGVEAVEIKAHGGGSRAVDPQKTEEKAENAAPAVDPKKVLAERQQQCEQEKQRLSTLKGTGRIRMTMDDGKTRYLTPEEVSKEVSMSQEFISQACK